MCFSLIRSPLSHADCLLPQICPRWWRMAPLALDKGPTAAHGLSALGGGARP